MEKHKILVARFINPIKHSEIALFRGVVLNATKENPDILFHNHKEDGGLRYSYPLIQYKRINGRAALVCLGEGTEAIGKFFSACNFEARFGSRVETLEVESVKANQYMLQTWDSQFDCYINNWLPFSAENYRQFMQLEGIAERIAFLERIMIGNILSFCKGMGVHLEDTVCVKITSFEDPRPSYYKGVKLLSFSLGFKTNVSLPDHIGLGKGVSLGNGVVVSRKQIATHN